MSAGINHMNNNALGQKPDSPMFDPDAWNLTGQ